MTEHTAEIPIPRALKGRRARQLWRQLTPIAAQKGTLTPATEPLLALLCMRLALIAAMPDSFGAEHAERAHSLAKRLGVA